MKTVEIIETNVPPTNTSPPGIYLCTGMIYVAPGNNIYPVCAIQGQIQISSKGGDQSAGMSEQFILQLLAVGNRPDRVHDFTR